MKLRTHVVVLLLGVLLPVIAMAGGRSAQDNNSQEAPAAVIRMTMNKKFVPDDVTIDAGDTVEWVADDPYAAHTVTDDPDAVDEPTSVQLPKGAKPFDSGTLSPGSRWRYRFTVPGVYRYVCLPHRGMTGRITVRARSAQK